MHGKSFFDLHILYVAVIIVEWSNSVPMENRSKGELVQVTEGIRWQSCIRNPEIRCSLFGAWRDCENNKISVGMQLVKKLDIQHVVMVRMLNFGQGLLGSNLFRAMKLTD